MGRSPARRRSNSPVIPDLSIRYRLIVIGKLRNGALKELQALYAGRIVPGPAIIELEERRALPAAILKAREAEMLLGALPAGTPLVALDEHGYEWSSRVLADRIAAWRAGGFPDLAFAIGGADGLGPQVLGRAEAILSLGPMTWPHRLVRVMLLEQLYRAQQILAGHPYHRD